MSELTKIPHDGPRVESGPIQFGDDWPGIFLRGDNAMAYATYLRMALAAMPDSDALNKVLLTGLAKKLEGCNATRLSNEKGE